jgi:2-polyprenyl-6-methoxyphenol hydroxylase-like FAD-dependent oxidoreductase
MNDKTVLISGGGIAGPTLAFWLKAAGFNPTLVEVAPALRTGGYVIDFWGLGYDIAERMGLREEIHRIGYDVRELRTVNAQGERVAGFGTKVFGEITGGRYVTLGRSDLSRLLFEKIKHDTEIIFGNEIVQIEETADDVRVNFRNGGERRFDLVIGADGLHSGVRKLVFGPQERFEKRLGYLVAAFEVTGYRPRDDDLYVMFCEPGRMLGRFALHGDRTLFLFVFAADVHERLVSLQPRKQKDILRRTFGDGKWECPQILDELERAHDLYIDHVSQIIMPGWSKGRVALVGDAAFCVSLTAGQGTALAMTAAYVLAGELARAARYPGEAFGNYEKILRDFIVSKQKGAERFASAFAPKTKWGLFFRNLVINATAIPGLARLTFGRDIVDKLVLPQYQWPPAAPSSPIAVRLPAARG